MPIYHCQSEQITGCEVLIRCKSHDLQDTRPDVFIPIAEQYDLIQDIDLWVIETTLQTISRVEHSLQSQLPTFNVNISATELHNKQFPKMLLNLLKKYHVRPSALILEITETSLVEVGETSITILYELKKTGVSIALDDFGTGYTAFSQLTRYPVDCLKIDKSFIDSLSQDSDTPKTTINAILSIARSYKLETVAEGVESFDQLSYLREHGCDKVQGFYFSQPLAWDTFLAELKKSNGRINAQQ
ncbi:EAL domain-containing protein [Alteromonas sp. KUL49]|uniref:EAL domain-containing protein n=1 Tax=Alteromonas sp. KUL49 TaxID=2480798 RepID=UPI0010FFBF67|nr:EAL domain-containing protein [Alteromonas sp. KUL49]GEA13248.1 hypothetical protein KUL49_36230 [Alteromonas sp. KUL49]